MQEKRLAIQDPTEKSADERLRMPDCPYCERNRDGVNNFCRNCGKQFRNPIILRRPKDPRAE